MLPATLVIFATTTIFLLELCVTSPVYNMQPAFITANIGTTGRNIRNLPCISRKNNQSGVCMFAIDCLKANGTHLGTCIDRFYFGSCCHIEPINDIIENTIDTDIIPSREPPQRIANTTVSTTVPSTTVGTTSIATTTKRKTTTTTTLKPSSTTTTTTTTLSPPTTVGYKLTTFQSVDGNLETTAKPTTTPKPKPSKTTPKFTTTRRPTNSTLSQKLTTTTRRPITTSASRRNSTVKPQITKKPATVALTTTKRPVKPTGSKKPVTASTTTKKTTTVKPLVSSKPTKKTTVTKFTTTSSTTSKVTSTTTPPSTTKKTVELSSTTASITASATTPTTTSPKPTSVVITNQNGTKEANETLNNVAATLTTASSSTASASTTQASIVTWAVVDNNKNESSTNTSSPSNSTSEEWIPITTTDNWVPLPSVQPAASSPASSSSVSQLVTTVPTTIKTTTTTESASKPSITYIPLESTTTTSATLNVSSVATEGGTTQSAPVTSTSSTAASTTTNAEIRPVNMSDFTDVCGRRMYPEARIVGGEKSSFGKWPWQISLRQWRTSTYLHKCGAALLNENWAITAAHCVDNVPPSDLLLRLGEHDLSTESEPYLHQERRVQIVASHPNFDPRTFEYDLALLRFYEPVTFQPNILPVCVPQDDENFVGRTAHVTGWGRLYEDGPLPSVLQEVSVPVINNSVCESMYRLAGYIEHIPHIFICAGWRRGGFDSCEGDSGGPMVIQREDKRFLLAGVISWGIGCAEPNQPGVYTRISEFRDWINQILQF